MKGEELWTQEVLAGGEVRQGDAVCAPVGDEGVNCPDTVAQAVLVQLDPDIARAVRGGGRNVNENRAFVGLQTVSVKVEAA